MVCFVFWLSCGALMTFWAFLLDGAPGTWGDIGMAFVFLVLAAGQVSAMGKKSLLVGRSQSDARDQPTEAKP